MLSGGKATFFPRTGQAQVAIFVYFCGMFTVIGIMLAGIAVGYAARKRPVKGIQRAITALIWALLFLLGWEAGSNEAILRGLPTLGREAGIVALAATLGSALAAGILWKTIRKTEKTVAPAEETGGERKKTGNPTGKTIRERGER